MADYNGVTDDQLLGLIASTLAQLPARTITSTFEYQHYEVMDRLFTKDNITNPIAGGRTAWTHKIILDKMGSAGWRNVYGETKIIARDVLSTATGPWSRSDYHFTMTRDEALENLGRGKLVDLEISRDASAATGYADLREAAFFGTWNSAADPATSYTLKYWVPQLAQGQNGAGFYGGHVDTAGTAVGGIQPSGQNTTTLLTTEGVKDKWNSYQAGGTGYYVDVDEELLATMQRVWLSIHFQKPAIVKGVEDTVSGNYRIYVNLDTRILLSDLAASFEGVGHFDLRYRDGDLTFNGAPIIWIPALDSDTANPIYFVNLNTFKVPVLNGMNMHRSSPMIVGATQHLVYVTFVSNTDQIVCENRRLNACINKTA